MRRKLVFDEDNTGISNKCSTSSINFVISQKANIIPSPQHVVHLYIEVELKKLGLESGFIYIGNILGTS